MLTPTLHVLAFFWVGALAIAPSFLVCLLAGHCIEKFSR